MAVLTRCWGFDLGCAIAVGLLTACSDGGNMQAVDDMNMTGNAGMAASAGGAGASGGVGAAAGASGGRAGTSSAAGPIAQASAGSAAGMSAAGRNAHGMQASAGSTAAAGTNANASAGAAGSSGGTAGTAAAGGGGKGGSAGTFADCPYTGHVSYTIAKAQSPSAIEQAAYDKIKLGMDKALTYYNCYTNITKSITASYVPSVQTADGNISGSLRFGSNTTYMDYRTCMHEISHTVGIGQASNWGSFVANGLFTGAHANAQLKAINDKLAMPGDGVLHADNQHFWPYGINQQSEVKSEADLIAHCQMVVAIRMDLGLQ